MHQETAARTASAMLANGGIAESTATMVITASATTARSGGAENGFPIPFTVSPNGVMAG
jgi:hypothetical protein